MNLRRPALPFHDRLAVVGLAVVGTAMAGYAVMATIGGDRTAPGLVVVSSVAALLAWSIARRPHVGRALTVVGGVVTLPYFFYDASRLTHPDSAVEFVPLTMLAAGTTIAVFSCAMSIVEHRRGSVRLGSRLERSVVIGLVVAMVALEGYSVSATLSGRARTEVSDGATVIVTRRSRFVPDHVVVARSGVRVLIRNVDWVAHTFAVDELGFDAYVGPQADKWIIIPTAPEGTYSFRCDVVGHVGMDGEIEVAADLAPPGP